MREDEWAEKQDDQEETADARKPVDLFERMQKAVADEARVGEFKIHVCDNDCKVYIRTTWGPVINTYEPRKDTWLAVKEALDELDDIKAGTDPKE